MTTKFGAQPRVPAAPLAAVGALSLLEARRMIQHPAPWVGIGLSIWFAVQSLGAPWSGAAYVGLVSSTTPMLLGVSIAGMSSFGHELTPLSLDAPMSASRQGYARLLAGLSMVGLVATVVGAATLALWLSGGIGLGDEPGRTLHAHYTTPELLQPVTLTALGVALGAALVHVIRHRLAAGIVLFMIWLPAGEAFWLFQGNTLRMLTLMQVQPLFVNIGPPDADPAGFPAIWLLNAPGDFQGHWARLAISPALAAWHNIYLIGLTMLAICVAVPGRWRPRLLAAGAAVSGMAVAMQWSVSP
ncbi:hypothetical protein OHA70_22440 [Kribbella sp. NBC_00382]|uniref:hypothetical protein n=1 Tax=Kribbella sp. NBC_00382 TaxID=2975967 RepID=UPI002E24858D